MASSKVIGILGGMGPFATLSFYHKILEFTGANKDWEHYRTIIDINTKIPSRSRHYLYNEESPIPSMIESCIKLENYPVDFIAIPCNSASYYLSSVQSSVRIPIINIMEVTVKELVQNFPAVKRVAVFGGVITYECKVYESLLKDSGISYVHHSQQLQKKIEEIIERIKLNESGYKIANDFRQLVSELQVAKNIEAIILGCTEFGCLQKLNLNIPIIDSSSALARYVISISNV